MPFKFHLPTDILIMITAEQLNRQNVFQRFVLGSNQKEFLLQTNENKIHLPCPMLTTALLLGVWPALLELEDLKYGAKSANCIGYISGDKRDRR